MRTPKTIPAPNTGRTAIRRFSIISLRSLWGCLLALCLIVTSSIAAPPPDDSGATLTRYTYTQYHMGVDARLVVYAQDLAHAERACTAAFARMAVLDTIMSDYRRDSELMRLCAKAGGPGVRVSPDLFTVLRRAQQVSELSQGAFDVTAGPLVGLWRKARKSGVLPDPGEIERARKVVGWKKVVLDERARTVRLLVPDMRLDLGGIGKGYGADGAQRALKDHGVTRALVQMGGDIVVTGPPPGTRGWTIRVPNAEEDQGPKEMQFAYCALSTSGDTEQFALINGRRYSHIVDPRTGQALTSRVQVSITAADGLTSDPLSKCLSILDKSEHHKLLAAYPGTRAWVKVLPMN